MALKESNRKWREIQIRKFI